LSISFFPRGTVEWEAAWDAGGGGDCEFAEVFAELCCVAPAGTKANERVIASKGAVAGFRKVGSPIFKRDKFAGLGLVITGFVEIDGSGAGYLPVARHY
jgi:hypothetical protein